MHQNHDDTIAACATPPGEGGIAVVRISGPDALRIALRCLRSPADAPAGMPVVRQVYTSRFGIRGHEQALDDVVWWWMKAPKSYTGEDTVEISFHGSPFIVSEALAALHREGARLARPGEFTQRAFLNGKIDLSQAEAVIDLIHSRSSESHKAAYLRLRGDVGLELRALHEQTREALALVEAYLNFPEDIVDEAEEGRIERALGALAAALHQARGRVADRRRLYEGLRVFLVGLPNAGKSSLFNLLAGHERAIVSEVPGTTRDYIEADFSTGGYRFRLFDQAGWRSAGAGDIERQGIQLAQKQWESADVFLFVTDVSRGHTEEEHELLRTLPVKPILAIGNKADLLLEAASPWSYPELASITVSSKTREGLSRLEKELVRLAQEITQPHGEQTMYFDQWQRDALARASESVERAVQGFLNAVPLDLLAVELREAVDALGSLLGETTADDIMEMIFQRFCIGK